MNFIVIGGGPTGVEMAGAIAELAKGALAAGFCSIDSRCARIVLGRGGPMAVGTFRSVYRISQPADWRSELVLELRELPARRAPDHRDS